MTDSRLFNTFALYRATCHRCNFSFPFVNPVLRLGTAQNLAHYNTISCPNCQHIPCQTCSVPHFQNGVQKVSCNDRLAVKVSAFAANNGQGGYREPLWAFLCTECGELQGAPQRSLGDAKSVSFRRATCVICRAPASEKTLCWRECQMAPIAAASARTAEPAPSNHSFTDSLTPLATSLSNRARSGSATMKAALTQALSINKSAAHEVKGKIESQAHSLQTQAHSFREPKNSFNLISMHKVEDNVLRDFAVSTKKEGLAGSVGSEVPRRAVPPPVVADNSSHVVSGFVVGSPVTSRRPIAPSGARPSRFAEMDDELYRF